MAKLQSALAGLAAVAALLAPEVAAQSTCSGVTSRFTPKLGAGYRAHAIATGLRNPRHLVVDSAGNLLVAEAGTGMIRRLVLREQGEQVCVASSTQLGSSGVTNHGIALSADGKTLFASNLASVTAFPYDATAGTAGAGKVVVTGMSNTGTHPTRAILTSKWNPDVLMVARGSNGNVDTATTSQTAGRSMIKTFSISKIMSSPAQYSTDGSVLAWGLRNIVGMGEDPASGGVFSVENQMDDVRLNQRDVHNENPAERLSYHGVLNASTNARAGLNFGYPSCVPAWDTQLLGVSSMQVGGLFSPDSVPRATDCASRATGALHFHSHTAPLDVKFTADGKSAYIAFHGSWNRRPADGYRVMKVDFLNGQPTHPPQARNASIPVLENQNAGSCPNGCFRPVGLDFDAKGRLYVSSDSTGEVWVIYGA